MSFNNTILIVGGTGFIGSHLCSKLLELGNYVICLDNNFTGRMKNIQEMLKKHLIHFHLYLVIQMQL